MSDILALAERMLTKHPELLSALISALLEEIKDDPSLVMKIINAILGLVKK